MTMIGNGILEVRRLEMLLAVARTGSFTAAADSLSFTRSAVSQQMSALERATKVRLFERTARGVQLTEAGRSLCQHAEAVLERLAEAETELEAMGGLSDSRLRFGSFSSATGAFAAEAFRIFGERYSGFARSYSDGEPYESLVQLASNELDLAVIFELNGWPTGMDYRGVTVCPELSLQLIPLFDDPYLLVLPAAHRLAGDEPITIDQLAGERILVAPPWQSSLESSWTDASLQVEFDSSCRGTGFEALQALVSVGRGLTLMPRLALGWLRDDLIARPVEGAPVRHVKIAHLARPYGSSATRAMVEILVALAEGFSTGDDESASSRELLPSAHGAAG